jgi:nicotinate-nucleotide adenylyltransferase
MLPLRSEILVGSCCIGAAQDGQSAAARIDSLRAVAHDRRPIGGMMRHSLPYAAPGQSVGLFGGSFDPPHAGHVHVSREALKRFGLDQVWWLVSPGNPLKANGPAPLDRRMAAARGLVTHPRITVTDIEAQIGTRYTAATLARLTALYPQVRFVWLMGADNLAQFHRWQRWEWILRTVPVGVLARPGQRISARTAKAARVFRDAKLPAREARLLARAEAPAWCFLNLPMVNLSSSEIRARGDWPS